MRTPKQPLSPIHSIAAAVTLALFSGALVSCGADAPPKAGKGPDDASSVGTSSAPHRPSDAPILGVVSPHGDCDPAVVDIDHERPTAHITYTGQEGDHISVKISFTDDNGAGQTKESEFTLAKGMTGMQLPTDVTNDSISEISVAAISGPGQPGTCTIPVNGAMQLH
ncbi:hypothetical protein [Corynebacterium lactis]|uniref:Uncharacterized protein n=1 Tax=Corynebacterium lactis RW2-5 TaxID=1408189 RepID=A0A0K2H441_9CORY|nr:hypothetical protein [Corynebacterium lactis]ALA68723.1 hypothetical protein CLAC_11705 [Corynebacterium lactis RW2-5]